MKPTAVSKGMFLREDEKIYRVLDVSHSHMGRGSATVQIKIKNLRDGKVLSRAIRGTDEVEEVEIEKEPLEFIFQKRDDFWFKKAGERIMLNREVIGEKAKFLKPEIKVIGIFVEEELISVELPIKAEYIVKDAPPNMRGNTVQGSNKTVILETGAQIQAPFFIEAGQKIVVNIEEERYVERA